MRKRKALLAKVHIAKKELGLRDEDYRAVLWQLFQKDSARHLTIEELYRLVETFRACGWAPRRARRRPEVAKEREKLARKAWAICADLGYPWAYADGLAKKMFGVERLVWCTPEQLHKIVAALEYHKRRRKDGQKKN